MTMIQGVLVLGLALLAAAAGEPKFTGDASYLEGGGARNRLDVYAPAEGADHPVVVWIHGGAWRAGDKRQVQGKPKAFTEKGYVFVAVNYRFVPQVDYKGQAADVAKAVRWVRDHAKEHGGDPKRIFLMGHSAGAHLAALVATDGRYLEAAGLKLADLSGVILLDGAGYDVARQVEQAPLPALKKMYVGVFGDDPAAQKDASPLAHVAAGKGTPPFLILHVATRRDSKAQSEALAAKLREAGVEARVVPAAGKTHATINRELGDPDDAPTREVFEFLRKRTAPADGK